MFLYSRDAFNMAADLDALQCFNRLFVPILFLVLSKAGPKNLFRIGCDA